jgi:hypothetical protein
MILGLNERHEKNKKYKKILEKGNRAFQDNTFFNMRIRTFFSVSILFIIIQFLLF